MEGITLLGTASLIKKIEAKLIIKIENKNQKKRTKKGIKNNNTAKK